MNSGSIDDATLGERLFAGRTADIYGWEQGRVIKVFRRDQPRAVVEREASNTDAARRLGVAVPTVYDIVDFGDRFGLVMARVDGPTMMDEIDSGALGVEESARRLAQLQAQLNGRPGAPELQRQREMVRTRVAGCQLLKPERREALLAVVEGLPDGDRLCHGDFHPRNVIRAADGEVTIDWIDASCGSPAADAARSSVIFLGARATGTNSPEALQAMERFYQVYLETYLELTGVDRDEHDRWLPVRAAARLAEGVTEQQDWLLAQAHMPS